MSQEPDDHTATDNTAEFAFRQHLQKQTLVPSLTPTCAQIALHGSTTRFLVTLPRQQAEETSCHMWAVCHACPASKRKNAIIHVSCRSGRCSRAKYSTSIIEAGLHGRRVRCMHVTVCCERLRQQEGTQVEPAAETDDDDGKSAATYFSCSC